MATWQNAVVTQRGLNLQAKFEAGSTLQITKVVSSANYVNPATLDRLTDIPNQKQTLITNDVVPVDGGKAILGVMLTNIGLTESYILNQVGAFANDPDLGEILYFVAQAEEPDTIPSEAALPDFSISYSFNMIKANADIISARIDPLALATKDDILALRAKDAQHDISLSAIDTDISALQEKDAQHDAELSNKVNYNQLGIGNQGANIPQNDCNKIEESGFFRCGPDAVNTLSQSVGIGDPQGEIITSSVWNSNARAQTSITPNRHMGYRNHWGGAWNPWKRLATAEPPQIFKLPLSSGFSSANATYSKTQESLVVLNVVLQKDGGNIVNEEIVAQLPVGFRPGVIIEIPITYYGNGLGQFGGMGLIDSGGRVAARTSGYSSMRFGYTFVAVY